MKYLFLFLLVGLVSCGDDATGDIKKASVPKLKEYSMDEVTIPYDTMAFFKNDMTPVTGIIVDRYSNDSIMFIGTYLEGRPNGIHRYWYNSGTHLPPYEEWIEGQFDTKDYDTQSLESEKNWKNGKLHGECRNWYRNGQLKSQINFIDGQINGIYKLWYDNGKKKYVGNYLNGKEYGLQRYWYEDGQLQSEHTVRNGVPYETRKDWHEDGKLALEANYENGKENRIMKTWDANGTLRWEAYYKNDTVVNDNCWDEDGKKIECPDEYKQ